MTECRQDTVVRAWGRQPADQEVGRSAVQIQTEFLADVREGRRGRRGDPTGQRGDPTGQREEDGQKRSRRRRHGGRAPSGGDRTAQQGNPAGARGPRLCGGAPAAPCTPLVWDRTGSGRRSGGRSGGLAARAHSQPRCRGAWPWATAAGSSATQGDAPCGAQPAGFPLKPTEPRLLPPPGSPSDPKAGDTAASCPPTPAAGGLPRKGRAGATRPA